jgi:hypothetical protein
MRFFEHHQLAAAWSAAARATRRAALPAVGVAAAALTGCNVDSLVDVTTPDVVPPGAVTSAAALPTVYAAALGDFTTAFQGSGAAIFGQEGQILYSGLLGDELLLSDTFQTRQQIDSRTLTDRTNSNNENVFRRLQIARASAERAARSYGEFQPNQTQQAEAFSLAGFTYLFFAEHYCGGVPFSTLNPDGTTENDTSRTTVEMLGFASARFDSALAVAGRAGTGAAATRQLNLARVGKARTLVNQGRYAEAATVVAAVPTTFVYTTTSSLNTARQNNGIWSFNRAQRRFSVADREGTNGLPYRTDNDPRVLFANTNGADATAFNGGAYFVSVKYSEQDSPATVASGVEARLIEAEAAFNAGSVTQMVTILNGLRANQALYACPSNESLPNFTCPGTPAQLAPLDEAAITGQSRSGQLGVLFRERAYWLYLTAHRLGDMRRLARATTPGLSSYGLGVNTVFPVGAYPVVTGTTYGNDVSFPVPFAEQGVNPRYNPNACVTTDP